jgi:peptidoglycan/LPS O-acetylase OafA/YrhL
MVHGTAPSSGPRLAGIEGLRALAASAIVIVHVWGFTTPGGALGERLWIGDVVSTLATGVTLFFTLSGFLLYRPFAAAIARGFPHMPLGSYLRNRVLRIVPAYWVILVIAALVFGCVNVRDAGGALHAGRLMDIGTFLSAAFLLQDYRPSTMVIGIGPAWSLAVEIVFYLVLPVLVVGAAWAARRAGRRRERVLVLLVPPLLLLVLGLSGKYAAHLLPGLPPAGYENDWHSVIERSFWAQADLFSFGMVVAVMHTEVVDGALSLPAHWRWLALGVGAAIFLLCAVTMHQGEQSYLLQNTGEAFGLSLLFATIVLPDSRGISAGLVRWLERPWMVAIGLASYSLFLWHHPVILWLTTHDLTLGGVGGLAVNFVVVAFVAGTLSAMTYRLIEVPALRRKHFMPATQADR